MEASFNLVFMVLGPIMSVFGVLLLFTFRKDRTIYSNDIITAGAFLLIGGLSFSIIGIVDYFDLYSHLHFLTKYWEY